MSLKPTTDRSLGQDRPRCGGGVDDRRSRAGRSPPLWPSSPDDRPAAAPAACAPASSLKAAVSITPPAVSPNRLTACSNPASRCAAVDSESGPPTKPISRCPSSCRCSTAACIPWYSSETTAGMPPRSITRLNSTIGVPAAVNSLDQRVLPLRGAQQQAVRPALQHGGNLRPCLDRIAVGAGEQQREPEPGEHVLGAAHHRRENRADDVRHEHPHDQRAPPPQRPGHPVRPGSRVARPSA